MPPLDLAAPNIVPAKFHVDGSSPKSGRPPCAFRPAYHDPVGNAGPSPSATPSLSSIGYALYHISLTICHAARRQNVVGPVPPHTREARVPSHPRSFSSAWQLL